MRVQQLSDIHLEFHQDGGASFVQSLDPTGVDALVIAGDIGNAHTISNALDLICRRYAEAQVLFVAGNHEYYGSNPRAVHDTLRRAEAQKPEGDRYFLFRNIERTTHPESESPTRAAI